MDATLCVENNFGNVFKVRCVIHCISTCIHTRVFEIKLYYEFRNLMTSKL